MRAILIDAVEKTVREVEYDGTLETAYSLLRCELIDVVHLPDIATGKGDLCHDLLVDDEGLLTSDADDSPFFVFRGGLIFAGSGLIVGPCDDEGETTEATLSAYSVKNHVMFYSRKELLERGVDPQPQIGFVILDPSNKET